MPKHAGPTQAKGVLLDMRNPIRLLMLAETTTYRTQTRSTGEPEWEWEDAMGALAMGGATTLETAAFEYRWRGSGGCRHMLYAELMIEGLKAQDRHRWPERLEGRRYIHPMVQLALDVEQNPRLDGTRPLMVETENGWKRFPGWWCQRLPWMGERQWDRVAEPMYALIRQPLDIWHGEAMRKARNGLEARDMD
jgi:hypothetical protein